MFDERKQIEKAEEALFGKPFFSPFHSVEITEIYSHIFFDKNSVKATF